MIDQASKLRTLFENKNKDTLIKKNQPMKIYSVVSGKGGVGKTNFSVNLAIKLQQAGKRVLILDADIGMSNANIILGIEPPPSLSILLNGDASLEEIIVSGPEGVDLISGGADLFLMETLNKKRQEEILEALEGLGIYDIIIIDNGGGISKHTLTFSTFAHEIILITTPEPTALTDAYRVLKVNSVYKLKDKIKLVINQVHKKEQAERAFDKLKITSEKFLDIGLEKLGFIYNDTRINRSIMEQRPFVLKYPNALASQNIEQIAKNILGDKSYRYNVSNFKEFKNRLLRFFG